MSQNSMSVKYPQQKNDSHVCTALYWPFGKQFQSTTVTSQYFDDVQEFAVQIWSERVLTFRDYKLSLTKDLR